MSPKQRENKNKWLRDWRKKKRQTDPAWRKKQAEYASSYIKRRRNDGTDFDQKRKDVANAYYHRLIQTDEGRQRVRESARRTYWNTVLDVERKEKLRERNGSVPIKEKGRTLSSQSSVTSGRDWLTWLGQADARETNPLLN